MSDALRIHVRDGLSQPRRQLPALAKGYFDIDELSFEQLLEQIYDYSQLVRFQGLEMTSDELSPLLFAKNEIMVMVKILAIDLDKVEHNFQEQLRAPSATAKKINLAQPAIHTLNNITPHELIGLLDQWLMLLSRPESDAGEQLYRLIESLVIGLGREILAFLQATPEESQTLNLSPNFQALFSQPHLVIGNGFADQGGFQAGFQASSHDSSVDVESLMSSMLKALEMIQKGIVDLLPVSMTSQNNDPAISLRIVFVKLYQRLQLKLNRFTLNFFDFYFTDVLQAKPRGLIPDSVHLVLQTSLQGQDVVIPQGAEFIAGIDQYSQDIIYRADQEQIINDAQVARLHTLYFPRESVVGLDEHDVDSASAPSSTPKPEPTSSAISKPMADACWLNTIPAVASADKKAREEISAHPIFGAPRSELDSTSAITGRLGFAIANKILLLGEGKRQVNISIQFSAQTDIAMSQLNRVLRILPSAKHGKSDLNAKFFAHFGSMFELRITSEKGWLAIPEYKPAYSGSDKTIKPNTLRLSFVLPESAPPITAFDVAIHGEEGASGVVDNIDTAVPVLQVLLKENYVQYPYDILKQFVIRELAIDVKVEGIRNLILHNQLGQLSPLSPFAPFGPVPEVGSYFIVGSPEIGYKQVSSVDFEIEWNGLPNIAGAFGNLYKDYRPVKNTKNFVASVSVMADGQWLPSAFSSGQQQPLFTSQLRNGQEWLEPRATISAAPAIPYYRAQESGDSNAFRYSTTTKSGLFKLTLQGPAGAFGHKEYSALLTNTLTHNSRVKIERLIRPLPNTPYTPEISSIRLNYTASATMNLNGGNALADPLMRDQFLHLHPLGWESITPLRHSRIYLVPQYADDGALLIGITGSECRFLSLFFHLKNNSLPITITSFISESTSSVLSESVNDENADEEIVELKPVDIRPATKTRWEYLCNNQWRPVPEKNLVSDSTQNFMTSGIVQMIVPAEINLENTVLPSGLFWLKVSANQQLANFSDLYSVYAQAVKATWVAGEHAANGQPMTLIAGSVKRTRNNIPGITGVTQICNSFGGEPAESMTHLRTRMSERLRHKNRALTPMDYEMLILNEFPEIYKVKCFANILTDRKAAIAPGCLSIIPIPYLNWASEQNYKPHFDGYLIERIRKFVSAIAPAFAKIIVENPVYEEIQVRCAVHYREGLHHGHHHNRLNLALCDYLSPWSKIGNGTHFGWSVSEQDVKSYVHNLEFVEHVTDFSLLRIAPREEGLYVLDDTAAPPIDGCAAGRILPSLWWSTAVPVQNHYLLAIDEKAHIGAEVTGYDELEVGSTFIIA